MEQVTLRIITKADMDLKVATSKKDARKTLDYLFVIADKAIEGRVINKSVVESVK